MEIVTVSAPVKPLTKDETKTLLSFIEQSKIINNKATNAMTNKLKTQEWDRIAAQFNSVITTSYRTPQQLRLKWENLKKNARKRNAAIRLNNIKTGGGGPAYIPPDDILERVAALLGNTVDGLPAYYGGDSELEVETPIYSTSSTGDGGSCSTDAVLLDSATVTATDSSENEVLAEIVVKDNCITELPIKRMKANEPISTPRASGSKKKLNSDENRAARNKAMVEYYTKKSNLIEVYYENILLKNKKLKLELERRQKEDGEPPS